MRLRPRQAFERITARIVFASYPAGVADPVEVREQEIEVDLAGARLVAIGNVGDLHVADASEQALERAREIALHDLHVEEVVLQPRVGLAGRVQHIDRLRAVAEEGARNAARVERLDHQLDAHFVETPRGVAHVRHQHVEMLAIDRRQAGNAVEPRAADPGRVVDGTVDAVPELALAAWQAGDAALAAGEIAGRQVVQHHLDTGRAGGRCQLVSGVGVGKLVLDVAEAGGARGGDAIREVVLDVQGGEIGGELRHNGQNNLNLIDVAAAPWWAWPVALFAISFLIGIVAVLAGVGGGVLFVPLVGTLFPFHLDFVRGAGLMFALAGTLAAGPQLLRSGMASLRLVMTFALVGSVASFSGALVGLALRTELLQTLLGVLIVGIALLIWRSRAVDTEQVEADAL